MTGWWQKLSVLVALLGGCGHRVTTAPGAPACTGAERIPRQVATWVRQGRLDRALRGLEAIERRCGAATERTAEARRIQAALGLDAPPLSSAASLALIEHGLAALRAGEQPTAQRAFDRALASLRRHSGLERVEVFDPASANGMVLGGAVVVEGRLVPSQDESLLVVTAPWPHAAARLLPGRAVRWEGALTFAGADGRRRLLLAPEAAPVAALDAMALAPAGKWLAGLERSTDGAVLVLLDARNRHRGRASGPSPPRACACPLARQRGRRAARL